MSRIVLFSDTARNLREQAMGLALALVAQDNAVVLMSPPDEAVEALQAAGLAWQATAALAGAHRLPSPRFVTGLARQLRAHRPDLVHSFSTRGVIHGSLAARLAGVPARVNTVDGVADAMAAAGMRGAIGRRVLRLALAGPGGRVVVHGHEDQAWLAASGCVDMASVRYIGAGIPAHAREARMPAAMAGAELATG